MLVVDHSAVRNWRNHFAGAEVGFVFDRETCEFFNFLRGEELVENDTLRR